jgi:hypothetical protein
MIHFKSLCPHCLNETLFTVKFIDSRKFEIDDQKSTATLKRGIYTIFAMASCITCNKPCVAELSFPHEEVRDLNAALIKTTPITNINATLINLWPSPPKYYTHPSIPEKVRHAFRVLQRDLHQPKEDQSPPLIIAGCRMVLDVALTALHADGDSIAEKIKNLAKRNIVTGPLSNWADHLRSEGNDAVHKLIGTLEDAEELVSFTKFFLQYSFELPYEIKKAKGESVNVEMSE